MSDVWKCPWCGGEMTEAHLLCAEASHDQAALVQTLTAERDALAEKLAKAVAFIEFLDENYRHVWGETARLKIRTLHAELTGGKDE
jgi:hypothetical protein